MVAVCVPKLATLKPKNAQSVTNHYVVVTNSSPTRLRTKESPWVNRERDVLDFDDRALHLSGSVLAVGTTYFSFQK
jgi:hypothetical protein